MLDYCRGWVVSVGDLGELIKQSQSIVEHAQRLVEQIEVASQVGDIGLVQQLGLEYGRTLATAEGAQRILDCVQEIQACRECLELGDDSAISQELDRLESKLAGLVGGQDAAGPMKDDVVIMEIKPGAGGDEAGIFAADLLRMYQRYAEFKGWKFKLTKVCPGKADSIKEACAEVVAPGALGLLSLESGVHRVQRVPETESMGRVHTSTAAVCVFAKPERVDVEIDERDIQIERCRASGPGGQSVNTTDSAITIVHLPTGIRVSQRDERSQTQNEKKARATLLERLIERKRREIYDAVGAERYSQVGSRDRSDKIRTYNYSQNRVTDHKRGVTLYKLDRLMQGGQEFDEFLGKLAETKVVVED